MAKCFSCGTIHAGFSCPICSAKEDIQQSIVEAQEDFERALERGNQKQTEAIESLLENERIEREQALEEAASVHKKTTAEAHILQSEKRTDTAIKNYSVGLYEQALQESLEALRLHSGNFSAYGIAAKAYASLGRAKEAKKSLEAQVKLLGIPENGKHAFEILQNILTLKDDELLTIFIDTSSAFSYFPLDLFDPLMKHSMYVEAQKLYDNTKKLFNRYIANPMALIGHAYGIEISAKVPNTTNADPLCQYT